MWLYLDTFERVHNPLSLARDVDVTVSTLGPYYFRMPSWGDRLERLDDQGVLVSDFDHHHLRGATGQHYMPINIAQYAIAQFDQSMLAADEATRAKHRERFLAQARWFLTHQVATAAGGVWQFQFALGNHYDLQPPWISALAQGEALSVLTRAYQTTGDSAFLEAARRAAEPFGHDVRAGGVRSVTNGAVFYEEYPTDPPHHVLNGAITALFGLLDLVRVDGDATLRRWLRDGLDGVGAMLPAYDAGWWSRYSLSPYSGPGNHYRLAAPHYHCIHIAQLEALARAFEDDHFRAVSRRWLGYARNPLAAALMNGTYVAFKRAVKMRNVARSSWRLEGARV